MAHEHLRQQNSGLRINLSDGRPNSERSNGTRRFSIGSLCLPSEQGRQADGNSLSFQDDCESASVSDFQVVFNQMKQEHPDVSMGGLQQKTMQHFAVNKLRRDMEEREEEAERQRKLAGARKQNKFDRWVNRLRSSPSFHAASLDEELHPNSKRSSRQLPPNRQDSSPCYSDGRSVKFTPPPPQRRRSFIMNLCRPSTDDKTPSLQKCAHKTASEVNFALRKSVGDFVDRHQVEPDLPTNDDEYDLISIGSIEKVPIENKVKSSYSCSDLDLNCQELHQQDFSENSSDFFDKCNNTGDDNSEHHNDKEWGETKGELYREESIGMMSPCLHDCESDDNNEQSNLSYLSRDERGSSELIVGFVDRSMMRKYRDKDDSELLNNSASDFTAWET